MPDDSPIPDDVRRDDKSKTIMRLRTMYAVCATDSFPQDAKALFDEKDDAEEYADIVSRDSDAYYAVVPVTIDANTIEEPT